MMIVAHRIAWQMASVAERCELLLGHLLLEMEKAVSNFFFKLYSILYSHVILSLWYIVYNMRWNDIEMVQRRCQRVLRMTDDLLVNYQTRIVSITCCMERSHKCNLRYVADWRKSWYNRLADRLCFFGATTAEESRPCATKTTIAKLFRIRMCLYTSDNVWGILFEQLPTLWNSTCAPSAMPCSSRMYCGNDCFTEANVVW